MKLWCFGDSNTYGYDPRGFSGGRYAAPWPELLAEKTGDPVVNDGRNGRMIPGREYEFTQFRRDAERYGADALIVMLGANDLLNGATAGEAAARMAAFLNRCGLPRTLLVGPPPMRRGAWVPDDGRVATSRALERRYFREFEAMKAEQAVEAGAIYHYDTPLLVAHETDILRRAGFRDVDILHQWGVSTYTVCARK